MPINVIVEKRGRKRQKKKAAKKKDDRCTRIAKRKYDAWPSAYASGAVVRCRAGKIWKGIKEDFTDEQLAENKEYEKGLDAKIRKALEDEGGAAGMDALEKHTEASAEDIKAAIKEMDDVGQHKDGDYILDDNKEVQIVDEVEQMVIDAIQEALDEKKKKKDTEGLRKWFKRKGAPGKTGGWVDCNTCRKGKDGKKKCKSCGRQKGEKRSKYPRCRPTPAKCKGYKRRGSNLQKEGEFKHDFDSPERIMRKFKDVLLSGAPRSASTGGFDPSTLSKERFYFFAADTAVPFGLPSRVRDEMIDDLIDTAKKENFPIIKLQKEEVIEEIEYNYIPAREATYDDGNPIDFILEFWDDIIVEAEYQGRKVKLNKPMRGDVKKFKVYVKDPKTKNVKKVNFGDPNMRIKKSNPKRRKSFRARHNCDNPGPKTKARYWSCRKW